MSAKPQEHYTPSIVVFVDNYMFTFDSNPPLRQGFDARFYSIASVYADSREINK